MKYSAAILLVGCVFSVFACNRNSEEGRIEGSDQSSPGLSDIQNNVSDRVTIESDHYVFSVPRLETLFEGKNGLERFLNNSEVKTSVELTEEDRVALKNLLIQWYWMSQTKGLFEECKLEYKGEYWMFMSNTFPEIESYTINQHDKRLIDMGRLVGDWSE